MTAEVFRSGHGAICVGVRPHDAGGSPAYVVYPETARDCAHVYRVEGCGSMIHVHHASTGDKGGSTRAAYHFAHSCARSCARFGGGS